MWWLTGIVHQPVFAARVQIRHVTQGREDTNLYRKTCFRLRGQLAKNGFYPTGNEAGGYGTEVTGLLYI